jgi:8-oxo-dGTP pyrophosphatase MutT (NUDIX family)
MTDDLYRPAVGVMLLNSEGQVWVGQRLDSRIEAWQMPQDGLDPGEDPLDGVLRELQEETGIGSELVQIVSQAKEDLRYDLPEDLVGKVWKERWRGQRHEFRGVLEPADLNDAMKDFRGKVGNDFGEVGRIQQASEHITRRRHGAGHDTSRPAEETVLNVLAP